LSQPRGLVPLVVTLLLDGVVGGCGAAGVSFGGLGLACEEAGGVLLLVPGLALVVTGRLLGCAWWMNCRLGAGGGM
jgi:hypothetical protein